MPVAASPDPTEEQTLRPLVHHLGQVIVVGVDTTSPSPSVSALSGSIPKSVYALPTISMQSPLMWDPMSFRLQCQKVM
jgi:hypothetical protein